MGVVDYLTRRRVKALEDRHYVFEVTDFTVDAGTDWSAEGYIIGEIMLDPWQAFYACHFIEFEDPNVVSSVQHGLANATDYEAADWTNVLVAANGVTWAVYDTGSWVVGVAGDFEQPSAPVTLYAGLWTPDQPGVGQQEELHIVRARTEVIVP